MEYLYALYEHMSMHLLEAFEEWTARGEALRGAEGAGGARRVLVGRSGTEAGGLLCRLHDRICGP